jgi:hypothetical protein
VGGKLWLRPLDDETLELTMGDSGTQNAIMLTRQEVLEVRNALDRWEALNVEHTQA